MRFFVLAVIAFAFLGVPRVRAAAPQAPAKPPIRIGVMLPLTGAIADFGLEARRGIELAASQLNEKGGINGAAIELIICDTRSEPEEAEVVANKLIKEERVCACIGDIASSMTIRAARKFKEAEIPLITPTSTNDTILKDNEWVFRAVFNDTWQGTALGAFSRRRLKRANVAIISEKDSGYATALVTAYKEKFKALKGEVAAEVTYESGTRDLSTLVTALGDLSKLELVFHAGYYVDAVVLCRELKKQGYLNTVLGCDGWECDDWLKLGGPDVEGNYWVEHFCAESKSAKPFVTAFKHKHERAPNSLAALGYDTLIWLAKSIESAKSSEPRAIRGALAATNEFQGVTGAMSLGEDREPQKSLYMYYVEKKTICFDREFTAKEITAKDE